jgi:hypothetical protein
MSTSPSPIPKVRTYAADLNTMRGNKNVSAPKTAVVTPQRDTSTEQVIPPFHTFTKPETPVNTSSSPVSKNPTPLENSLTETQKILTASSFMQSTGEIKESLPAVIITDTKHKRFKLSEAIASSVQNWWSNKKQAAGQKKIPKYTVPVAERRKGVIQKATVKTGRASSADHSAVLTRIKATKQIPHTQVVAPIVTPLPATQATAAWETQEPVTPKVTIQNQRLVKRQSSAREAVTPLPLHEIKTGQSWETDIQAKVNALAEPDSAEPSPIIVTGKEFTKIKQARIEEQERGDMALSAVVPSTTGTRTITPTIPPVVGRGTSNTPPSLPTETPTIRPIVPTVPAPISVLPNERVAPVIPVVPRAPLAAVAVTPFVRPKITPVVPNTPEPIAPIATPETVPVAETIPTENPTLPSVPVREERRFAPPREPKRNFWALFAQTNHVVFITAAVLVLVVGSGLGLRAYRNAPAVTTDTVTPVAETVFPGSTLYTETNFVSDKNQLSERIKTMPSDTDSLVEIVFVNQQGVNLSAPEFLSLFDASVPFDFVSSLNNITFGNYRGAPWILLTISDKNTALGGMLAWETSMGRNLAPIFSTMPATSYARFTDSIINSADVRMLKNEAGTEEIVYGFVSYDKLLITSNTTAFLNLAQNIQ